MARAISRLTHSRRAFLKGAAGFAFAPIAKKAIIASGHSDDSGNTRAYVGSYTSAVDGGANGEGIYLFEVDSRTGLLSKSRLAAKTRNPSWICIHPSRKYLYAINEITDFNGTNGSVSAFSISHQDGGLTLLNSVSSEGAGPAHMSLDALGKFVFVA